MRGILPPWWKMVLTYMVPYLVSTTGAVSAMLAEEQKAAQQETKEVAWLGGEVC